MGHRDPITGAPFGDKTDWTTWDYALMTAVQTIEDLTDNDGLLVWEAEEDEARMDIVKKTSKFQAAVQRRTGGQNYKATPGEYFVPYLRPPMGKEKHQTITEWREKQVQNES